LRNLQEDKAFIEKGNLSEIDRKTIADKLSEVLRITYLNEIAKSNHYKMAEELMVKCRFS